ncbi:hypothetical protein LTR95_001662 [Oleoguttula sp. CCFEE 5521]
MARMCFRLLHLPPELRLRIYKYMFPKQRCLYIWYPNSATWIEEPAPHIPVALLRASRMVLEEAQPILYKQTVFEIISRPKDAKCKQGIRLCWLEDFTFSPHVREIYLRVPYHIFSFDEDLVGNAWVITTLLRKINECRALQLLHVELRGGSGPVVGSITLPYFDILHRRGSMSFSLVDISGRAPSLITMGGGYRATEELAGHLKACVELTAIYAPCNSD